MSAPFTHEEGSMFYTDGYDIVGLMRYAEGGGGPFGEAIVLNNNSTHFLVAVRPCDGEAAQLEASFRYSEREGSAESAYRRAIEHMVRIAFSR